MQFLFLKESFSVKIISKSANSIRTLERVRTKCLILTIAMHGIGLQVSTLLNHKKHSINPANPVIIIWMDHSYAIL